MRQLSIFSALFFVACSNEKDSITPENLIPVDKMVPLIVDLQILESHYQRTFQRPDLYKSSLDSSSAIIFANYDVDKATFDSSYSYYSKDVHQIYGIYEAALDSINFRLSQPNR